MSEPGISNPPYTPTANPMSEGPYILVSGRWDNTVAVVDLAKAIDPANDGTPKAIVTRPRVTPDIDAGDGRSNTPASGQPVSLVVPKAGRFAYVVNHSGRATPDQAAAFQHGHPGTITVLDLAKALDPANNRTTGAIAAIIATGTAGPVGIAITPDDRFLLVSSAEAAGLEDGGREITVIDARSGTVVRQIVLAVGRPGRAGSAPSPHPAPHPSFGCFPNPNGIAVSPDGRLLFTGNGGTDDVSVIDLERALAGDPGAEIARVEVAAGPFAVAVSPDGAWVAVANRESARTGVEGNAVSLIDVRRASAGAPDAERARIRIGTDDPAVSTRPFGVAFAGPRRVLASCFRSNTVSLIDVDRALAGSAAEIERLAIATPDGGPSRPRGIAVTPDGRYAAITGGAKGASGSSLLFILDIQRMTVAGTVTGVGNESYLLDILPAARTAGPV
jgi:DNA-binding beta-propeller fold protein YncE